MSTLLLAVASACLLGFFKEVPEDRESMLLAFLRMKLRSINVVLFNRGDKLATIFAFAYHYVPISAFEMIAVHVVEQRLRRDILEQAACFRLKDTAPPYVRNSQLPVIGLHLDN